MKKNKYFQPAFKPAFKSSKPVQNKPVESTVPEEKVYLKDIIQKLDGDLPDNAFDFDDDYIGMPDNYDPEDFNENSDSSDQTLTEEQKH